MALGRRTFSNFCSQSLAFLFLHNIAFSSMGTIRHVVAIKDVLLCNNYEGGTLAVCFAPTYRTKLSLSKGDFGMALSTELDCRPNDFLLMLCSAFIMDS